MKAPFLLAASVAVGSMLVVPASAEAAIAGPVHAEARVADPDNWIDNAAAPSTTNSVSTLAAEFGTRELRQQADLTAVRQTSSMTQSELAAVTAIDVLRLMADLSDS